jgi:NitT/TauT family transport system substrate-binding protein
MQVPTRAPIIQHPAMTRLRRRVVPTIRTGGTCMSRLRTILAGLAFAAAIAQAAAAAPLNIGYSDWPGYLPWQIAIEKGWFKQAGVDVNFLWFDYSASLDAFTAGKLDADHIANGDSLVLGGSGAKNVMIIASDYSNGNDMVIGAPGIKSVAQLKGKKIAVEVGLVDHLLVETALKKEGLTAKDVTLVNTKTNDTPQVLASGQVAAIAAWQPSSGQALHLVPGSRPIYTSRDAPGLLYDGLVVSPQSLASRRDDWRKIVDIWFRCLSYIRDPKTEADAFKIMGARDGLAPDALKHLWAGARVLTREESKAAMRKTAGLDSVYGSSQNADNFNVANNIYKEHQSMDRYFDSSLVLGH